MYQKICKACNCPFSATHILAKYCSEHCRKGAQYKAHPRPPVSVASTQARLFAKTLVTPEGCYLWTGTVLKSGVGQFRMWGKSVSAHRASWILQYGEIPEGQFVYAKCLNKLCISPRHLALKPPPVKANVIPTILTEKTACPPTSNAD